MRKKTILSVFFFVVVFGAATFWSIEKSRNQTRQSHRVMQQMQQLEQQQVMQQQEKEVEIEGLTEGTLEVTE